MKNIDKMKFFEEMQEDEDKIGDIMRDRGPQVYVTNYKKNHIVRACLL